jgi:hypothetical protein
MRAKAWGLGGGVWLGVLLAACSGPNGMQPYQNIGVTVVGVGEGHGYVYTDESAVNISCSIPTAGVTGNRCEDNFNDAGEGGAFSLVAQPMEGSVFAGWSRSTGEVGCTEVTGNVCTLRFAVEDEDVHFRVTARFEPFSEG